MLLALVIYTYVPLNPFGLFILSNDDLVDSRFRDHP